MKEIKSKSLPTDKKRLILGSIIATMVAVSPYLFYLYESVPNTQVWETFLFTYDSKFYGSAFNLAWTLANKFVPLYLLFIWFFTCRHWWYHALLVPIAMYAYQISTIFNDDLSYVDELQIWYLIPIMAVIIPSIYLIRAKIFNSVNDADKSMQELEDEFRIGPKSFKDFF